MSFMEFINFHLVPGIVLGSVYAVGAIGITLVFGILRFAHFAHGDMATLGAFVATGFWSRLGHIAAGLVFIAAGVIAWMNPSTGAAMLAIVVVTFVGIAWIFEGVAALATIGLSSSRGWTAFYAIISILAGIALMFAPLSGFVVLVWWIGISLIVMGVIGIIRAFSLGRQP